MQQGEGTQPAAVPLEGLEEGVYPHVLQVVLEFIVIIMIIVMSICIWRGCRWRAGGWARGRGNGRGKRIRARGQRVCPCQRRSGGWAGGDRRRATAVGGGIGRRPGQWRA